MSLEEITEWAIKNKVKLSFSDQYDEAVKELEEGLKFEKGEVNSKGDGVYSYMVDATIYTRSSYRRWQNIYTRGNCCCF